MPAGRAFDSNATGACELNSGHKSATLLLHGCKCREATWSSGIRIDALRGSELWRGATIALA
jgi:hypothetical protein